jgi:opacity protein-like surface antigen
MRVSKWIAALGIASLCAGTVARADNTGIYAGASVGQAKTDFSNDALDDLFDGKDTGFKLVLGYRVLDWVGFEAEYVDLGEITLKNNQPGITGVNRFRLEEAAFGAFGVLYWSPAPAPVDLFAKGGFVASQAHVRTNSFFGSFDDTDNSTDLAWGVGAQVRFSKLAVRLEYERFDIDVGTGFKSPEMISLGASWTFF